MRRGIGGIRRGIVLAFSRFHDDGEIYRRRFFAVGQKNGNGLSSDRIFIEIAERDAREINFFDLARTIRNVAVNPFRGEIFPGEVCSRFERYRLRVKEERFGFVRDFNVERN